MRQSVSTRRHRATGKVFMVERDGDAIGFIITATAPAWEFPRFIAWIKGIGHDEAMFARSVARKSELAAEATIDLRDVPASQLPDEIIGTTIMPAFSTKPGPALTLTRFGYATALVILATEQGPAVRDGEIVRAGENCYTIRLIPGTIIVDGLRSACAIDRQKLVIQISADVPLEARGALLSLAIGDIDRKDAKMKKRPIAQRSDSSAGKRGNRIAETTAA